MLLSLLIMLLIVYCLQPKRQHKAGDFRQKSAIKTDTLPGFRGNQKKPDWVVAEVIRLKAILGQKAGCRKVAQTFNRLYEHRETVGKSFVNQIIQKNQFEIMVARRKIKNKLPRRIAVNLTWAMDLSFYTSADKVIQPFIGIIDHGSRKVISLNHVINKSSWVMLGYLCLAIGQYGKPKKLRTDNESIFNSFVFKTFLGLVNIQHQRIPTASPWCNGRIERLFGTLKPIIKLFEIADKNELQHGLNQFKTWYNHHRTHQNLGGKTPEDIWRQRRGGDKQK